MTTKDYKELLPQIPTDPGVYKYIDKEGTILYVGKAKNIRKRIGSYFGEKKHQYFKTRALVRNADHLEFTVVDTEQDALLLENTLIKKYQPRYNVNLKDAKSYTYICIKKERFPRVFFTRKVIRDGSTYLGPYTSKFRARIVLDIVKKLFTLRTCNLQLSDANITKGKFKVCLEYHIKNCKGPCVGLETAEEYDAKILQIKNILKGDFKPVRDYLKSMMMLYSDRMEFELAQDMQYKLRELEDYQSKSMVVNNSIEDLDVFAFRDEEEKAYVTYMKIVNGSLINTDTVELEKNLTLQPKDLLQFAIDNLRTKFNSVATEVIVPLELTLIEENVQAIVPQRGEKKKLLDLAEKNLSYYVLQMKKDRATRQKKQTSAERILKTLKSDLQMDVLPYHIECFDNSNIQGTNPVASCVVFKNAKPSKRDYRKFNIKTVVGPDDFASMEEVVYRRYRRLLEEDEGLPQLLVVDGGKGQLSSAMKSINLLGIKDRILVIGIAKRLEEIYFHDDPIPIYINKKSESLKLIQQLRNEAHRFAITFHRDQRSKNMIKSSLTEISGVGEKISQQLLSTFGSVSVVRAQSLQALQDEVGVAKGKLIFDHYHHQKDQEKEKDQKEDQPPKEE